MQAPDTRRLLGYVLADALVYVVMSFQWGNLDFGTTGTGFRGLTMLSISSCFLLYVVVKFLSIWIHEGSHALMAHLVGCRVTALVVGSGPRLAYGRVGRAELTVRVFPVRGQTNYGPISAAGIKPAQRRWIAAAGPASHLVLLAIAGIVVSCTDGMARGFAAAAAVLQISMYVGNAVSRPAVPGVRLATDGWTFHENRPAGLAARRHAAEASSAEGRPGPAYELLRQLVSSHPADLQNRLHLATHAYRSGRFAEAAAMQRSVAITLPDGAPLRANLLVMVADAEAAQTLVNGTSPGPEDAASWNSALSNPALPQDGPSVFAIRHSAAVVRLAQGDADAALELCQSASRDPCLARADAALVAATAALAALRGGRTDAARGWAAKVPHWCPLRAAIDRELATSVP